MDFSSPSTGMGGLFFIGSKSEPIGHCEDTVVQRSKSNVRSIVYATNEAMAYDMKYDVTVKANHFGCCYRIDYGHYQILQYSETTDSKLSECAVEETKWSSTCLSYDMSCHQLQSLVALSQFVYIGEGGCRDADKLAPARYWHDRLELHSCQLQCSTDDTCLGVMYVFQGRWTGTSKVASN